MKNLLFAVTLVIIQYSNLPVVLSVNSSTDHNGFSVLVKESSYVDKTLFIKEVLQDRGHKIVFTAPHGFGKTSILQMLKAFFEIEANYVGDRLTWIRDMTNPVKDTPNYKLFKDTKIMDHKDIMNEHFGKYPVVHLDFKSAVGFNHFNETQDRFRDVLHEAISKHSYLKDSNKLYDEEREFIRLWSSDEYKLEDMGTLIPGLEKLSKYLFKHFDRTRVIVLIDHYDSPIFYCVTHPGVAQDAFNYVINVVQAFFHIPKDDFYVDTFILTGVSQVEEPHVSNARFIKRYEFLKPHPFTPFYGFTDDEVFDLLGRLNVEVDNDKFELVKHHYGGYESLSNLTISNPWSVLKYLENKEIEHGWTKCIGIPNLKGLLMIPDVNQKLERMLKGLPTVMELKRSLSAENLKVLRDIVNYPEGKAHLWYTTLFYTFFFQEGFLAFDSSVISEVSDARRYVIPNEEIKQFLLYTLK
ncbi:uncharacterized protein LOC129000947 [Macrosteles quadrilineatus]|uniref:uncharacterized protein LOC129000947 n=1 Tax=Macrosteles quadrilineatus TaxID=74068 RepID=UPI0023E19B7B|nr:uncharacterized protein LOC129000947 [Macrosteles quadrilineatus]